MAIAPFQKWAHEFILPTSAFEHMEIIYAIFVGSVIREGAGKLSTFFTLYASH
jgi:hypothetical protein